MEYDATVKKDEIMALADSYPRIGNIIIHSSPDIVVENDPPLIFTALVIKNNNCCGEVSMDAFVSNTESFTESRLFNSCLNKKVAISPNGEIKNCPSMPNSYGIIHNVKLKQALSDNRFKINWHITKDKIIVCQDCEFRYICTDCRAHLKDPNNILSKPAKCTYDPYSCTWESDSDNPNVKFSNSANE